ncbi:hypothetical protein D3C81_688320 [compost metagenome]
MATRLIVQGLEDVNHLDEVSAVLQLKNITSGILSVAFVRSAGVANVFELLAALAGKVKVYAGIRNGITSAQALRLLLDTGVDVYVVDTGTITKVFHPKLYFSTSDVASRLLVGSANLTAGGLSGNVEASLVIDLDHSLADQCALSQSVGKVFDGMVNDYPKNVEKLDPALSLDDLLQDARLADENIAPRPVGVVGGNGVVKQTPVMRLKRKAITTPPTAKGAVITTTTWSGPSIAAPTVSASQYQRVWRTEDLTERDLNIPSGKNTNATGSMNFDKGDLTGAYEWADFFRNKVFQGLVWSPLDARFNQHAFGIFRLVIGGIDCGEFNLKVRHDTKVNTESYRQRNAMTKLSWGKIKHLVAKSALIGRTFTLSKKIGQPDHFMIEID